MGCNNPLTGYRSLKVNEATGKRPVVFRAIEGIPGSMVKLPCGKCKGCLKKRSVDWGIRCYHEGKLYDASMFVTCSYNKENMPRDKMLSLRHQQLFIKRLRQKYNRACKEKQKLRYIFCGEYGPKTWRAHYHGIVFGLDLPDLVYCKDAKDGSPLYTSKFFEDCWGMGDCIIGRLSFGTAQYVAKYVNKEQKVLKRLREASNYVEPYGTQSRNPGIGIPWLKKNWKDVYPRDLIVIDGGMYKPPRAYDKWMEDNHPEVLKPVKRLRKIHAKKELQKEDEWNRGLKGIANEHMLRHGGSDRDAI